MDVGEFIVLKSFVEQIKLPLSGGRLISASDGIWDALNCEKAVQCYRGLPIEIAAKQDLKVGLILFLIGPLRCWPEGRSLGDMDVGEFIVPVHFVKQTKLPLSGGRLIMASGGVWDALNCEKAAQCYRGLPIEIAAKQVVKNLN